MNGTEDTVAEDTTFDRTVEAFASGGSRRAVMRGLAVGLLAAASGGIATDTLAKKKRKKPKQKKQKKQKTCKPLGSVSVPATGVAVTTPVLVQGQRYRLRAVGFWLTNAAYGNDAFAAFPLTTPNAPETTFQGVRLGLSVDGGSPDQWGTYNPSHIYEREVIGQGAPLSLRFTDPVPADNSGSLLVEILCA